MKGGKLRKIQPKKIQLRNIRVWQLVLILIPLMFLAATFLRLDHIKMTELKAEVIAADEAEDDAVIQAKLQTLQNYTFSHIIINITEENGVDKVEFGTGAFYLQHQYERAANAAIEAAQKQAETISDSNPNGNIYAAASAVCQPIAIKNGWKWNSEGYLSCMTSELAKYPAAENLSDYLTAAVPSTELYRYNYASPVWCFGLSGITLLLCGILIVIILIKIVIYFGLRILVKTGKFRKTP